MITAVSVFTQSRKMYKGWGKSRKFCELVCSLCYEWSWLATEVIARIFYYYVFLAQWCSCVQAWIRANIQKDSAHEYGDSSSGSMPRWYIGADIDSTLVRKFSCTGASTISFPIFLVICDTQSSQYSVGILQDNFFAFLSVKNFKNFAHRLLISPFEWDVTALFVFAS